MTRRDKLLAAIRANPKAVRLEDACKVAARLGFTHSGGQGSLRVFAPAGGARSTQYPESGRNHSTLPGTAIDPDMCLREIGLEGVFFWTMLVEE